MPRIKKPNFRKFRCRACGNHCEVKMVKCGNSPTSCLYSDAVITAIWEEICHE